MKEYTDAEGLMALPTSDLHNPTVCLGAVHRRSIKYEINAMMPRNSIDAPEAASCSSRQLNTITLPLETPLRTSSTMVTSANKGSNNNVQSFYPNQGINLLNNNSIADIASVDSSDTYASCQTHPFLSQGDLTGDIADIAHTLDELDMNDLYFASLEKSRVMSVTANMTSTIPDVAFRGSQVKKSASGEAALHSLAGPPTDELMKTFQSFEMASRTDHGSHASLNDQSVPKHRKTRFQQSSFNKSKSIRMEFMTPKKKLSHDSLTEASPHSTPTHSSTKKRRSSFMPSKSLASATKLINQHLFGIQSSSSKSMKKTKENRKRKSSSDNFFELFFI